MNVFLNSLKIHSSPRIQVNGIWVKYKSKDFPWEINNMVTGDPVSDVTKSSTGDTQTMNPWQYSKGNQPKTNQLP